MSGNSIGTAFRLTTFGESHGPEMGGIVDGIPAGVEIDVHRIQEELNRRRPGQSKLTTQRKETDTVELTSGIHEGRTTGTPIGFTIPNGDVRSSDYDHLADRYRPSHADFTYDAKFGHRDHRGGGRASARETVSRVVAGAIARQMLEQMFPAASPAVSAYVERVQDIAMPEAPAFHDKKAVDVTPVRCPHAETAARMMARIKEIKKAGDTVGGAVTVVATQIPARLGGTRL